MSKNRQLARIVKSTVLSDDTFTETTIADVILHVMVSDPNKFSPADVAILADRGLTLKIFMVRPGFDQNAAAYATLIRAAGAAGLLETFGVLAVSRGSSSMERGQTIHALNRRVERSSPSHQLTGRGPDSMVSRRSR